MCLESIDLYAKNWSKKEQVDLKYVSERKDHLKELVTDRILNFGRVRAYPIVDGGGGAKKPPGLTLAI